MSLLCVAREMELQGVRHGGKEMPLILRGEAKTGRGEPCGALGMQRRHRGDVGWWWGGGARADDQGGKRSEGISP